MMKVTVLSLVAVLLTVSSAEQLSVHKDADSFEKALNTAATQIKSKMSASSVAMRRAEQELMDAERDAQIAQDNADGAMMEAQQLQLYSDQATPKLEQQAEREAKEASELQQEASLKMERANTQKSKADAEHAKAVQEHKDAELMASKAAKEKVEAVRKAEETLAMAEEKDSMRLEEEVRQISDKAKEMHISAASASSLAEKKAHDALKLQQLSVQQLPVLEADADNEETEAGTLKSKASSLMKGVHALWQKVGSPVGQAKQAAQQDDLTKQLAAMKKALSDQSKQMDKMQHENSKLKQAARDLKLEKELEKNQEQKILNLQTLLEKQTVVPPSKQKDESTQKNVIQEDPSIEAMVQTKSDDIIAEIERHQPPIMVNGKKVVTEEEELIKTQTVDILKMLRKPNTSHMQKSTLAKIQAAVIKSKTQDVKNLILKNSRSSGVEKNEEFAGKLTDMVEQGATEVVSLIQKQAMLP